MTKVKHKTNVQLINDLMTHSKQGVLMQAFIIEAIAKYAEQTKVAPPWSTDNTFISEASWRACADEALEAINNRSK
jgi:hydroxymethylpyrimidine/phosphomethylpyrimidine kinase